MNTVASAPSIGPAKDIKPAVNWREILWKQGPVFALFSAIAVLAVVAIAVAGWPFAPSMILQNLGLYPQGIAFILMLDSSVALVRHRPDSPIGFLKERYFSAQARSILAPQLPLIAVLCLFLPLFALLKPMIPYFNPFSWDAAFVAWDQALFGDDAWRVMQPMLGYPIITSALAMSYHAWFLLVYPFGLFVLVHPAARHISREYIFAYLATWIGVGFVMATGFSSVGPVFLEPIMGDPQFAAQMAYLESAALSYPVPVLDVQEMLLQQYLALGPGKGTGISAMPSMHLALCMLCWLAARHISPTMAKALLAFTVIIWIGSVHLAYHYAVDGLVSIIAVAIIWKVSRAVFKWWDRVPNTPTAKSA